VSQLRTDAQKTQLTEFSAPCSYVERDTRLSRNTRVLICPRANHSWKY